MHRDVKPHNVMIDHSKRKLRLIDWGLGKHVTLFMFASLASSKCALTLYIAHVSYFNYFS